VPPAVRGAKGHRVGQRVAVDVHRHRDVLGLDRAGEGPSSALPIGRALRVPGAVRAAPDLQVGPGRPRRLGEGVEAKAIAERLLGLAERLASADVRLLRRAPFVLALPADVGHAAAHQHSGRQKTRHRAQPCLFHGAPFAFRGASFVFQGASFAFGGIAPLSCSYCHTHARGWRGPAPGTSRGLRDGRPLRNLRRQGNPRVENRRVRGTTRTSCCGHWSPKRSGSSWVVLSRGCKTNGMGCPKDVEAATQGLSKPTRAVFRQLLRRDPAERYTSALALQEDVSNVLRERGGYRPQAGNCAGSGRTDARRTRRRIHSPCGWAGVSVAAGASEDSRPKGTSADMPSATYSRHSVLTLGAVRPRSSPSGRWGGTYHLERGGPSSSGSGVRRNFIPLGN